MIYLSTPIDGECQDCGDDPCGTTGEFEDLCALTATASGGKEGYNRTFSISPEVTANGGLIRVWYQHYAVKDHLIITANPGGVLFDTGCVGGTATNDVTIPPGATSVTVQVIGSCAGGNTAWKFSITCIDVAP